MRKPIRHFVNICATNLEISSPIVEFGAYQVSGKPEENLRTIFPEAEYIGADMRSGPGVDKVLDLHDIDLPDESAQCVLCMDTLEHVEFPRKALEEIHRILHPNGIAIISSVFDFPIHDYPNDYWRFTPEGFRSLLRNFSHSCIGSYGKSEISPQTIVGVGFKGAQPGLENFTLAMANWEKWYNAILRDMDKANTLIK